MAEVEQPNPRHNNQLELIPKLVPTCQTPAVDGMVVHPNSPKSIANRKAVMEFLLINHPLDCPVCSQAGECFLQDYSYRYGRSESRFVEDKIKQPVKNLGPHVKLYADRCIMCTRCIRFTRKITGTNELGVLGRGNMEQIDLFPGKALDNEMSGNVIDICPVGAMLDKDFLFSQRVWFLSRTPSIDGLTASGDNIWIEHNEGRICRIKPRTNPQVNKWWISDEIRYGWSFVHDETRLTEPRRMQYAQQTACDWTRACKDAAAALKGAKRIALLASPMLSCEDAYLLAKLVRVIDKQAHLAVGPIPIEGQDKTFPGGYTVHAEKCPNSRGVRRALQLAAGDDEQILDAEQLTEKLADKATDVEAVLLTGNYPKPWATPELTKALGKKLIVLLDTLQSPLAEKADVLLPSTTWAEKSGTFENAAGRLQTFQCAIPTPGDARAEAQIALDLASACRLDWPELFDPAAARAEMAGPFADQLHHPELEQPPKLKMQYVAL